MRLNFVEGNDVKIGDPLVTIDPAPYEARVLQWQATKQRATAQLENAKVESLARPAIAGQGLRHPETDRRRHGARRAIYRRYRGSGCANQIRPKST